jgi:UDP-N-acetylglucosamine 2-epimerase (non-hydrolysing)
MSAADKKILCVVGARPNLMKIAPIIDKLRRGPFPFRALLVHTGQHYDKEMNEQFFSDLGIPNPDVNLEVGSGSHAVQTAEVMRRFEPIVDRENPDAVLVVGDINSTLACALVAAKKHVPVVHVEAGLRSYDRSMPEEVNRLLTDQLSDLLLTTERDAGKNLNREGIGNDRIRFVGNVMIDTLRSQLPKAVLPVETLKQNGISSNFYERLQRFSVLTLHRPSNVDHPETLRSLFETLRKISDVLPVVFAIHPRTRAKAQASGLLSLVGCPGIALLPPLGYHEMLGMMLHARVVLTDSGGIQEETTALGVPCVTLRENTERPITVTEGTNTVVGTDPVRIRGAVDDVLATGGKRGRIPEMWDGQASARIAAELHTWLRGDFRRRVA